METVKRILTKEKIDRQLSGQMSSTPFMSIKDNHSRRVTFDIGDELGDKIYKLTVMTGKLAAREGRSGRQFKPPTTKAREEDKTEVVMIDIVLISKVIKIDIGQLVETGDSIIKIEADQDMNKIIEEEILEAMQGCIKILKDKPVEESTKITIEVKVIAELEIGTGLGKGHFLETLLMVETIGVQAIVGPGQDQGQVQIETESDVVSVGNMIILQKTVLPQEKKEN